MWRRLRSIKGVRAQYEVSTLPYSVPRLYIPDFTVVRAGKDPLYLEIKGYFRPEDRAKMKAVKKDNPEADIRLVFASDGKLSSRSKSRYSDWCARNGFEYAIGNIPKEWFTNV